MIGRKEGNSHILKSQTRFRLAFWPAALIAVCVGATIAFLLAGPVLIEAVVAPNSPKPAPEPVPPVAPVPSEVPITAAPVRVQIPIIGVDAFVEHVGLTTGGAMDVPKEPQNTAWYELGPRPGETGSAVVAGHVDWYDGEVGVFENLHELKRGDEIHVQDESGVSYTFVVRETRIYDADADATDVFFSTDGKAHFNLITCTGNWDTNAGQYEERLIVFADQKVEYVGDMNSR